MRAASVIHSLSRNAGGLFYTVRELNQALSIFGVDNEIFGLRDEHFEDDRKHWEPMVVRAARLIGPRRFGFSTELARLLDVFDPELVHVHGIWQHPGLVGARWAQRHRRPYLVSAHGMLDSWAVSNQQWKKKIAGFLFESRNLRRTNCLRALNESEYISFRKFGLKNPVCIIPNGIAVSDQPLKPEIREKRCLLYLGRLHPKKGLMSLLRAWSLVRREHPDWELKIVGWGEVGHQEELEALAQQLQLGASVKISGPSYGEQKERSFVNADAFILPSLSEGLPTVVLEAWSYGLPALMTPECNLPEGFVAGAAVRIEPNLPGIEAGLRTMLGMSEKERAEMGQQGRQLVRRKFSWREIGVDTTEVYKWLLHSGPTPLCVRID